MKFIKSGYKSNLSDEELIQSYLRDGDGNCIGALFERYAHLIFGVCMKYFRDEDKSKDAVLEIFEKLASDFGKHTIQYFKSWLYMVAKNHCLMQLRQEQSILKKQSAIKYEAQVVEMFSESHQEKIQAEIQFDLLAEAISSLNADQKICIELFYLQQKCYKEITDITGYSMLQVKSFIQNGKRNLKIFMLKKNEKRLA